MRDRVAAVAGDLVIDPVESELATHDRLCAALNERGRLGPAQAPASGTLTSSPRAPRERLRTRAWG